MVGVAPALAPAELDLLLLLLLAELFPSDFCCGDGCGMVCATPESMAGVMGLRRVAAFGSFFGIMRLPSVYKRSWRENLFTCRNNSIEKNRRSQNAQRQQVWGGNKMSVLIDSPPRPSERLDA